MTPLLPLLRRLPRLHLITAAATLLILLFIVLLWPTSPTSTPDRSDLYPTTDTEPARVDALQDTAEAPALSQPPQPAPKPVPPVQENWVEYSVQSGDNLTRVFKRAGLGPREVYRISQAVSGSDALQRLRPGQTLSFLIEGGLLHKLRHTQDRLSSTLIEMTDTGYEVQQLQRTPEARTHYTEGTIQRSLFLDAEAAGLSNKTTMQLAEIFGWDIDFALDIRAGDHFRVLYEQDFLDDEPLDQSRILAAEFTNRDNTFAAILFTDAEGNSRYFAPDGRSMRKAFLRSPVDFSRISSRFKPERYHPVLGKKRPHRGVDYAAATGTPIKAAGDGKIIWRGTKGGYGRTVMLQHGGNITTLYAHMSRYQKGLANGDRVKQGQIIGYVGASGLATGPHLHYEFRSNGVHRNPLTVDLPAAQPVAPSEQTAFQAETERLMAALAQHAQTRLAMNEEPQE
ncbi:peptidoglycan DD-metalloendopeptidase family protein [Marinobacterium marinum]|uniref:peptidoglycan DD-metalloendopeptidase family protein n=1 Tax=Marinobacterium marinum TaxID=2756129 RepID=UPI002E1B46C3